MTNIYRGPRAREVFNKLDGGYCLIARRLRQLLRLTHTRGFCSWKLRTFSRVLPILAFFSFTEKSDPRANKAFSV